MGVLGEGERIVKDVQVMNRGNDLLSYLLECVRRGRPSDIEAAFADLEIVGLIGLIIGNHFSYAHMAFQYVSPMIAQAAVDGGMSWMTASKLYLNYTEKVQKVRSISALSQLSNQMFVEFADKVALVNYQFSSVVRRCRIYISEHIYEWFSVRDIAEALQISSSHLSHVYKRETGETLADYIRKRKISEAKMLLQSSSLTLTDIGEQLGYCSQSHFTDVFRKETGMTPGQFRNKCRSRSG